jgi:hypothetical protein
LKFNYSSDEPTDGLIIVPLTKLVNSVAVNTVEGTIPVSAGKTVQSVLSVNLLLSEKNGDDIAAIVQSGIVQVHIDGQITYRGDRIFD